MPAGTIDASTLAAFRKHFGADFHAFEHGGMYFILLNGPVINSGLPQEQEQRAWLEAELEACKDVRTFLFIHYPPYVSRADEPGSYDNIDEPGRSWLLSLIR